MIHQPNIIEGLLKKLLLLINRSQMLYPKKSSKILFDKFQEKDYLPFRHQGFSTLAIHVGQEPEPVHGSVNVPIHLSSTFAQKDIAQLYTEHYYTRCSNPTRSALEKCIAAIEYGKYCITFSSGQGATSTIIHTLESGDHLIVCDDVYDGTQTYFRMYSKKKFGFDIEFVDMTNIQNLTNAIKDTTKMIWIETPSNPTMKLIDIKEAVKATKNINPQIKVVVDNTFASPYLQSPLLLGADIVFNSCSKYIGGHTDLIAGAIVYNDDEFHNEVCMAAKSLGTNPSPFDCYLMLRGLKTLEERVIKATSNAYHLAHYLEKHTLVEKVFYPGLKDFQYHEVARKQMRGFGAMITFRIKGGKQQASKFLKASKVLILAVSLGGIETLGQVPAFMTHASVPAETKKKLGITENMIRLSIGLQSIQDIIEDVQNALQASQQ